MQFTLQEELLFKFTIKIDIYYFSVLMNYLPFFENHIRTSEL